MKRINKKGYMFTLDAAFAVLILAGGILFILSQLAEQETDYYIERMPSDIIGVLSYTKTSDLCELSASASSCSCPNYPDLQVIACSPLILNRDVSILELYSEVIYKGTASTAQIEDSIYEIFVTKNVIDENRFGFALLYTDATSPNPKEIYNTEVYTP